MYEEKEGLLSTVSSRWKSYHLMDFFFYPVQLLGTLRIPRLEIQQFLVIALLPDQGQAGGIGKIKDLAQTAGEKVQGILFHFCVDQFFLRASARTLGEISCRPRSFRDICHTCSGWSRYPA